MTVLHFKRLDNLSRFEGQCLYFKTHLQGLFEFAREQFAEQGRGFILLGLGHDGAVNPGNRHPDIGVMREYLSEDSETASRMKCWRAFDDAIGGYDPRREVLCLTKTWKQKGQEDEATDIVMWRFSGEEKEGAPGVLQVSINAWPLSFETVKHLIPPSEAENLEAGKRVHLPVNL